ncbi:hypothetical protein BC936DRAFT_146393, partial [Jimgerdemannia flammicorona]
MSSNACGPPKTLNQRKHNHPQTQFHNLNYSRNVDKRRRSASWFDRRSCRGEKRAPSVPLFIVTALFVVVICPVRIWSSKYIDEPGTPQALGVLFVERLIGRKFVPGGNLYYLVKWRGWEATYNTWEPQSHILDTTLIEDFNATYMKQGGELALLKSAPRLYTRGGQKMDPERVRPPVNPNSIITIDDDEEKDDAKNIANGHEKIHGKRRLFSRAKNQNHSSKASEAASIMASLSKARNRPRDPLMEIDQSQSPLTVTRFNRTNRLTQPSRPSSRQGKTPGMLAFENILKKVPGPLITVENIHDNEDPPLDFDFLNDWLLTPGVDANNEFLTGCDCGPSGCDLSRPNKCGCANMSSKEDDDGDKIIMFAYDKHGRVLVDRYTPIYECNSRCSCGPSCGNRVVQRGRTIEMRIFKTPSKGWGAKAMHDVPRGTYIDQYLGEVITTAEAERRGKRYDRQGRTWLFDLDFGADVDDEGRFKNEYTIDAYRCGSVSHFFNHSCEPNLEVRVVLVETKDLRLHRIAFFAKRDIKRGEELTFDYSGADGSEEEYDNDEDEDDDEDEDWDEDGTTRRSSSRKVR